jgi:hypothetical protein
LRLSPPATKNPLPRTRPQSGVLSPHTLARSTTYGTSECAERDYYAFVYNDCAPDRSISEAAPDPLPTFLKAQILPSCRKTESLSFFLSFSLSPLRPDFNSTALASKARNASLRIRSHETAGCWNQAIVASSALSQHCGRKPSGCCNRVSASRTDLHSLRERTNTAPTVHGVIERKADRQLLSLAQRVRGTTAEPGTPGARCSATHLETLPQGRLGRSARVPTPDWVHR